MKQHFTQGHKVYSKARKGNVCVRVCSLQHGRTWLNQRTMDTYRERMRQYYYDPSKYDTYLEQLPNYTLDEE